MFCKAPGTCQCVVTPLDPTGRLVWLVLFERRTCPAPLVYTRPNISLSPVLRTGHQGIVYPKET